MEAKIKKPRIQYLDKDELEEVHKYYRNKEETWVLVDEKKWFLPSKYAEQSQFYYNFEGKPNDTWLVTFPRSGTTWTQEMIWLLSNNMDFETAKSVSLYDRFPFLELSMVRDGCELESILDVPEPRFIKTHFPLSLIPNVLKFNNKVVYVARNPKDTAVSFYHFHKTLESKSFKGSFEMFWEYFEKNQVFRCPYWEHLKEAWAKRHDPNFLFIFYEEMNNDLLTVVKRVSQFLKKSYTDEQFQALVEHLDFTRMKNNPKVNRSIGEAGKFYISSDFIREGKSQAWHSMFTAELNEKANCWIEENLKDTDMKFPYVDIYS